MATLISCATGPFTTNTTWNNVATAGSGSTASFLDSEATSTTLTTSSVASQNITPGAITVDAVAVKVANSRLGTPTGTVTVELFDTVASSVVGTCSIDVADLPAGAGVPRWICFKFSGGAVLLTAGRAYTVRAKTSSSTQVSLYRDATTANWSRALRNSNVNASPGANDILLICGDYTGSGTGNSFSVTMDNLASTNWGKTTVCGRGTFIFGVVASSTYLYNIAGDFEVADGGTLTIGTSGSPMLSSSTLNIVFQCASVVQYGMKLYGGTITMFGATKTSWTTIAADIAAAGTSVTTGISTSGWASGDTVILTATTRTGAESEAVAINNTVTGTTVPVAAVTNAHSGTAPIAGEIGNLTRNIVIKGVSSANAGYISVGATCTFSASYVEMTNLGNITAGTRGVDILTTTGSCLFQYCSLHDCTVANCAGFVVSGAAANNITIDTCVTWNISSTAVDGHFKVSATTGTAITVNNNLFVKSVTATSYVVWLADVGITFTNNVVVSATNAGLGLNEAAVLGTFTGNVFHSNAISGINAGVGFEGGATAMTMTCWRNVNNGFDLFIGANNLTLTITAFGNAGAGVYLRGRCFNITLLNCTIYGGSTLVQQNGVNIGSDAAITGTMRGCVFSSLSNHTNNDIGFIRPITGNGQLCHFDILMANCLLGSPHISTSYPTFMGPYSFLRFQKYQQTAGSHRTYKYSGIILLDTAIYKAASPSARYTPNSASVKLESERHAFTVASGGNATVTANVRCSVTGDSGGATYNGNRPRLILKANPEAGVAVDTVLATATSAANGAWQALTNDLTTAGITITDDCVLEVTVDGDGTAGWFNVDDLSAV